MEGASGQLFGAGILSGRTVVFVFFFSRTIMPAGPGLGDSTLELAAAESSASAPRVS